VVNALSDIMNQIEELRGKITCKDKECLQEVHWLFDDIEYFIFKKKISFMTNEKGEVNEPEGT
jgi:hypothetical protein